MSTSLYLITNSKLTGKETQKDWDRIVYELDQLNMETTSYYNGKNEIIKEYGSWSYTVEHERFIEDDYFPFNVDFHGPFAIQPTQYSNIGCIDTIYRYSDLYKNYYYNWFEEFRNNLYKIVTIIGGTEVIYLADNCCDKLSTYLEFMVLENVPYEEIKAKMIQEFGLPVTDYSKLDSYKLSYSNIKEFFLDDFSDLKK